MGGGTIVALSSGRPPAAIALVRLSGPDALPIAARIAGTLPDPRRAALRSLRDGQGELIDRALVLVFPGPGSATGEDVVEFHAHGGRAVVDALLGALVAGGARLAEAGEFTRRALEHGRLDLTEAEGLADLLSAETEMQRRAALARAGGAVRARVEAWRERLLLLSAAVEHAIDYAEEEGDAATEAIGHDAVGLAGEMQAWLAAPRLEPLRDGIRVVLAGPPNSGKSSLLNALCETSRAIVTPVAGTTRDSIEVPLAIDGIPFVLIDTAGLRDSDDEIEKLGIERSRDELDRADIILWLDPHSLEADARRMLVHAKADLSAPAENRMGVSALTGSGLTDLRSALVARARGLLPGAADNPLTSREAGLVEQSSASLDSVAKIDDLVIQGELLRQSRLALDRLVGRLGVENVLDTLFSRFCVGK